MQAKTLSGGVVIVRDVESDAKYLLVRAYNYWDFPKGEVEAGEEPLHAAIRETQEETTITGLDFRWGHEYRETPPYGRGKVARYYLAAARQAEVSLPVNPELGRPEHDEFRWLPYEEARALLNERLKVILDWANLRLMDVP